MHKMRKLESDWFYHQCPTYLQGGKVILWDNYDSVYGILQINVDCLGAIKPFTRYRLAIRRHVPYDVLGLPLKFKVVGNTPSDPIAYTGYQREVYNNLGQQALTGDDLSQVENAGGYEGENCGCEPAPRIVEREVLCEIFDVVMFGFGNTATVDDIMCHGNEPEAWIELYVNDDNKFVIMSSYCHNQPRTQVRHRGVVVREVEVTTMPYTAKTLQIQRNQTEYSRPHSHRSGELLVQGNLCGGRFRY